MALLHLDADAFSAARPATRVNWRLLVALGLTAGFWAGLATLGLAVARPG